MPVTYQPGTVIASRYEIQEILGRGGVGITYAARMLSSGEQVALKIVSLVGLEDWKSVELLQREAQVLSQLNHPGIPSYIDYFTIDRDREYQFCIVQQLAPGQSLAQLVEEGWRTSEKEIKHIAVQVLETLTYLHQLDSPVIHRDIKPENLIRAEDGSIYLVDFGAVREKYQTELTQGSTVVGTFGYMAPEQFKGRAVTATDLYGFGATLLYLLTHRSPTELPHDNLKIKFRSQVKVSPALAQWLEKLVAPELETRFASAEEALTALKQSQWVNQKNWLKVGISIAGVVTVGWLGFHYRWLLLSRVGFYPVGCNTGAIEAYLEQGGSLKQMANSRDSALWCGPGEYYEHDSGAEAFSNVAGSGNVDVVEQLLDAGVEPPTYSIYAVSSSNSNKHLKILDKLLQAGAEVNAQNDGGYTPLHIASKHGHLDVVKRLLSAGAQVNAQNDEGKTPLHIASYHGNSDIVKRLISAGAQVNAQDDEGKTPLHFPLHYLGDSELEQEEDKKVFQSGSFTSIVEQLIEAGAKVNARDERGWTPLHRISHQEMFDRVRESMDEIDGDWNRISILEQLLAAGAQINPLSKEGQTPLDDAPSSGPIRKKLLAAGAKGSNDLPQLTGASTTFMEASREGRFQQVKQLLERGVLVNVQNKNNQTPLHYASVQGHLEVVVKLLESGADVNIQDMNGQTPLHYASKGGHIDVVQALLEAGAKVELESYYDQTPLHKAFWYNRFQVVEQLLEAGAEVNFQGRLGRDENGNTPLHIAADFLNPEQVSTLLAAGVEVNLQNDYGETPLHEVVEHNFYAELDQLKSHKNAITVIKQLLAAGARVNVQDKYHNTPLNKLTELAVYDYDYDYHDSVIVLIQLDAMEHLLDAGANPNLKSDNSVTPLHSLSDNVSGKLGEFPLMERLLAAGARVNVQDYSGETPLHKTHDSQIIERLLAAGANPNLKDHYRNNTPLDDLDDYNRKIQELVKRHNSIWKGSRSLSESQLKYSLLNATITGNVERVQQLLEDGAQVDVQNQLGWTPLHHASYRGHLKLIEQLLVAGAKANIQNTYGSTPLHYASYGGHLKAIKQLLDTEVSVNARNDDGNTPLHYACYGGHVDAVKHLLSAGTQVNAKNKDGNTPFHITSITGNLEVWEQLLEAGARVDAENQSGATPLHYAAENGNVDIAKRLLAAGAQVNIKSNFGWTTLHYAAWNGNEEVVKRLLAAGAEVNVGDKDGETPLHQAADRYRNEEVVKRLLSAGAAVNVRDKDGRTPLHLASDQANKEVVKRLLSAGAAVNVRDKDGETALDVTNNQKLQELLKRHGAQP